MANIANIQNIHRCDKNMGNNGKCPNYATYISDSCHKSEDGIVFKYPTKKNYRCELHKNTPTVGKKVFKVKELDQNSGIYQINQFLHSLVGKTIRSNAHTAKELVVHYVKEGGGIMCLQPITKKWKFVYYEQIVEVYSK